MGEGESEKLKKREWKYGAWAGHHKGGGRGGGGGSEMCFVIYFEVCHYNFMKKIHSKLSKNEPENTP